jgi:hypothetical protein
MNKCIQISELSNYMITVTNTKLYKNNKHLQIRDWKLSLTN